MVGREFMWIATMASCVLLYALARRLDLRRLYAAAAVLLFGLSPVDIWYHRMVSLDNLATTWALAAFVLAVSRKRSLAAVLGSAACFAAATWSKETIFLLLPALVWLIWQNLGAANRGRYLCCFGIVYLGLVALYPGLALLKGELLPGRGHVSLGGEIVYQLATRQATGSLLDSSSGTFAQVRSWIELDPWLLLGGLAVAVIALAIRRYRPIALALLVQLLYMIKGGYIPYAFVTAILPFAALLIAGVADSWWPSLRGSRWRLGSGTTRSPRSGRLLAGRAAVLFAVVAFAVVVVPHWAIALDQQSRINGFASEDAAVAWVSGHVPKGAIVVCDAYPWLDIKLHSQATPLYLWQLDSDPGVMRTEVPKGYKSISYMLLDPASPLTFAALPGRPTLQQAFAHSKVVARFGGLRIYKVEQ